MKKVLYGEIINNTRIADNIYDMRIAESTVAGGAQPGQFVNIYPDAAGMLLPRPISICEADAETGVFRVIIRASGAGTAHITQLGPGGRLRMTGPCGNGFPVCDCKNIVIAGGGIGAPPLLMLAHFLRKRGRHANIRVFIGFANSNGVILTRDFADGGFTPHISTDDGSMGFNGNVTDCMRQSDAAADIIYACGPAPMLAAVSRCAAERHIRCYVSLEERMACGLGACLGCAVKIKTEDGFTYKKVCTDGPVFDSREVSWDG